MAITLVGSPVSGTALNGGDVTLTLPAGVAQNDVVLVVGGSANKDSDATWLAVPTTAGYTALHTSPANTGSGEATEGVTVGAWTKVMGATPDTSVVGGGTGLVADGTAYMAFVLRGVNTGTIADATAVSADATLDPPAITTATAGAWVFACAAANAVDLAVTGPAGYATTSASANDTDDIVVAAAYKEITSAGTENPAAYTDWIAGLGEYAFTLAIRPAGGGGTTPVSTTRATTWNTAATVTSSRATTWQARGSVTAARATSWEARSAVTSSRATTWATVATVTATRGTTWAARASVTSQRSTTWNVAGNLASVSTTRATTWAVKAQVSAAKATTWDTRALVAPSARATTWTVRTTAATARATTWQTLAPATSARATTWAVLTTATTAASTTWAVQSDVPLRDISLTATLAAPRLSARLEPARLTATMERP